MIPSTRFYKIDIAIVANAHSCLDDIQQWFSQPPVIHLLVVMFFFRCQSRLPKGFRAKLFFLPCAVWLLRRTTLLFGEIGHECNVIVFLTILSLLLGMTVRHGPDMASFSISSISCVESAPDTASRLSRGKCCTVAFAAVLHLGAMKQLRVVEVINRARSTQW